MSLQQLEVMPYTSQCRHSPNIGADVSALVPFCPAQFNVAHCLHWYDYFELISDDDAIIQKFAIEKLGCPRTNVDYILGCQGTGFNEVISFII